MNLLGLLIDAAVLGLILMAVTEEFPGWGALVGCVLAIGLTTNVVGSLLPRPASLLGPVAGALVGAVLIGWLCGVSRRRAAMAAGIYLLARLLLGLGAWLIGL